MIYLEASAIAASLLSFILALLHLWIGFPYEKLHRRTQVIIFLALSIFIGFLTIYLGKSYKDNLHTTLEQSDIIKRVGLHEIYYPVPYCSIPNLKIDEIIIAGGVFSRIGTGSTADGTIPFRIIEQNTNGFKLELLKKEIAEHFKGYHIGIEWKANGKIAGCAN